MLEGKTEGFVKKKVSSDILSFFGTFLSTSLRDTFHHVFKFRKHIHEILELKENSGHAIQRLGALMQITGS
jgi:hypothetical protein